ncbi:MAG: hypothetical protein E7434_04605 [Ruminococcaceae bacterium]|nr:hypothetical protein [Oscillospiraceae bacterium]
MSKAALIQESFYESMKILPDAERLALYDSICEYSLKDKEPENLSPVANSLFILMRPNIDSSNKRYRASISNGKKGGAPVGNQNARKQPKNNQKTQPKNKQDYDFDLDSDYDSENDYEFDNDSHTTPIAPLCHPIGVSTEAEADADAETKGEGNKAAKPPHNRFFPPSVDEVREYCKERGNSVDPVRFVDYYTANGWMVGKSKMKDWKAAVRTWESNQFDNGRGDTKSGSNNRINGDGWDLSKGIDL